MSNLVTVNSGSAIDGSLKAGRVAISTDSTVTPSSGGKTWYNMINPAEGYVFISDPKVQGYNDGPPIIYPSQTSLPADILATVNGLPDRRGSVPFDNVWDALVWVQSTGKYFILDKTLNSSTSNGLKLYWNADNISSYPQSGSIWEDISGNGNYGTLSNGPTFNQSTNAIEFDGTNDQSITPSFSFTPYCLEFFLHNNSVVPDNDGAIGGPSTYQTLISYGYPAGVNLGGWTGAATNEAIHIWSTTGGNKLTYTRTSVPIGWHHWVFNWNGSNYDIWVDGQKQTTYASSGGHAVLQSFTSPIYLGGNNSNYFFWGDVQSFSLYTSSVSDSQVLEHYYGANIVTDGLKFALDAGNLVSYDKSGTIMYSLTGSLSGSLLNGVSYSDLFGGSFDFDGTDDYISTEPFDMGTPTDITLECWIKFNGTLDSNDRKVMHYDKTGTTNAVFQLRKGTDNSRLMYQAHNGTQWYTMTDADAIEANTWAHFTITHAGTSAVMYKNGVQSATATMGNLDWTNANNLLIGYRAASEYWKGNIAIMRIYNRALSTTEIQQNYNAEYPKYVSSRDIPKEDLVLDLDAGNPNSYLSGTTWTDLSGQGNNGTLTNSPVYSIDNGGAFIFDGVDDYVALGNLNTDIYSISLWVYLDSNVTSTKASTGLFYYGGNGSRQAGVSLGASTGFLTNETLTILNEASAGSYQRTGIIDVIPAGWRYISFNWNGSSYDIYIDGDKKTTYSGSSTGHAPLMNAANFELASNYDGNPQFEGKIASVKIYSQALDEYQIILNYNTQSPRYQVQLPRSTADTLKLNLDAGDTTSYSRTGTTWYDRSGNGNNATLYNSPTYTIAEGGVFDLDGTDDYFRAPASAGGMYNFGTDGTLEMWFRPDASYTTNHRLLCVTNNASAIDVYINPSGELRLHGNQAYATQTVPINEWTHLMVTYVGGTVQIYFNGEAQTMAGTKLTGYNITNNNDLWIGQFSGGGSYYFNGKIANTKIYHRGLTPSEVLENYKSTRSRFGTDGIVTSNLVFNIDAGNTDSFNNSGTSWDDLSGNGYDGTLTNGPTFNSYNGGNIEFDGSNDYVDFGSQFLIPGVAQDGTIDNLTIEAWVKWDQFSVGGAYDEIISWWKGGSQTYSDGFLGTSVIGGGSSTNPVIRFGDGWANTGVTFTAATDVGKWFHVVAVKTTSNAYVYINGELKATKGSALSWGFNGYGTIGRHSSGGGEFIDGEIAIVRLYNTNLSTSQILQNYNAERNRFGKD